MSTYTLTPVPPRRYKVIQWYTGQIAKDQIRMIQETPSLELVGAVCWHPEKDGVDVGRIAGIPDIGVKATSNIEAALALDADIVLLNPLTEDPEIPLRILKSGKNLISIMGPWDPRLMPMFKDIDRVARENNVSMLGAGNFPGLINDFLPAVASGFVHNVKSIHILERMFNGANKSADVLHGIIGFGLPPEEHSDTGERGHFIREVYRACCHQAHYTVADALGVLDEGGRFETTLRSEIAVAPNDIFLEASGLHIAKGTTAAVRFTIVSAIDGKPWHTMVAERYAALGLGAGWLESLDEPEWQVRIEAEPSVYFKFGTMDATGKPDHDGVLPLNSARLVNLIPAVVEARPGHVTFMDLPIVTSLRTPNSGPKM